MWLLRGNEMESYRGIVVSCRNHSMDALETRYEGW